MRTPLFCTIFTCAALTAAERSPVEASRELPVRVEKKGEGHWFIDFGTAAFGNVEFAAHPGQGRLEVRMGEALASPSTVERNPGGTVRYQGHKLALDPRKPVSPALHWKPPGWMKEGFLELPGEIKSEVMPFRYVEISGAPADFPVEKKVSRISWAVPFDGGAAAFESSSPELDAVWKLCKHSIKATTFMGLYVDGDRERKPYEADVLINQLSHYCLDARYDTARLSHEYLLEHPTWPTEWRLQAVILAWHDFLWSGDDRSLRRHYPVLKSRAMTARRTPEGLFRGWNQGEITDIIDWPAGERDGYDMRPEVKTVTTAFHYRSLVLLAEIAGHLGKGTDARDFTAMAEATKRAVNTSLWDEARGCYVDGLGSTHSSAHANFFPLALGLVPEERLTRVTGFLKPRGMACSVYGAQFLLDGLYDAGEAEHALSLLTSRGMRSWLNMSEKVGSTITLEAWDPSLKPNLDWNHAWGAAPSNIITRKLMGIEPLEPGFKRFRIQPRTASLSKARIKTPTPRGPVLLEISGTRPKDWSAVIRVPGGSAAEFHLPFAGRAEISGPADAPLLRTEDGKEVRGLRPGRWTIRMKD